MEKYNCKVILAGPAIGKTYLAEHDSHFVDVDSEKAKYKYDLYDATPEELEKGKFDRGEEIRKDSSAYAINMLKETIASGKIALISYHEKVLNYINDNNIDYCLVYADLSLREEYIERMKRRGNSEKFISELTNEKVWKEYYERDANDVKAKYKVKLKSGEYLSDIKDRFE